jgi:hypothetical protein
MTRILLVILVARENRTRLNAWHTSKNGRLQSTTLVAAMAIRYDLSEKESEKRIQIAAYQTQKRIREQKKPLVSQARRICGMTTWHELVAMRAYARIKNPILSRFSVQFKKPQSCVHRLAFAVPPPLSEAGFCFFRSARL